MKEEIHISGLHCTSCALNIDGALEDLGVEESFTHYARSLTTVIFDPQKISLKKIKKTIEEQGYTVVP